MKESMVVADTASMTGKTRSRHRRHGWHRQGHAVGLAVLGARVGITGRDRVRAEAAVADIRAASGNLAVDVFTADLSSQARVRGLAGEVLDVSAAGCAGQQRGRVLGAPARHR
jgi:hypothetical protein